MENSIAPRERRQPRLKLFDAGTEERDKEGVGGGEWDKEGGKRLFVPTGANSGPEPRRDKEERRDKKVESKGGIARGSGDGEGEEKKRLPAELRLIAGQARCTDPLKRYATLMRLAALVKALPSQPDEANTRHLLDEWSRISPGCPQSPRWRAGLWALFRQFLDRVQYDGDGHFGEAVRRARQRPAPACEALVADDPQASFAVRLAAELDAHHHGKPFRLAVRLLQKALDGSKRDACRVLARLQAEGILSLIEKGPRGLSGKASLWRYCGEWGDAREPDWPLGAEALEFRFGALEAFEPLGFSSSPSTPASLQETTT
jgi:hypothetical protein